MSSTVGGYCCSNGTVGMCIMDAGTAFCQCKSVAAER